jgi:uncharacterized protein
MAYHLVRMQPGPLWDHSRGRREQPGWDAHAAYLDRLTEHGIVVLGGPIVGGHGDDAVLVVDAYDEAAVLAVLGGDPWLNRLLTIKSIEAWEIWLQADAMNASVA